MANPISNMWQRGIMGKIAVIVAGLVAAVFVLLAITPTPEPAAPADPADAPPAPSWEEITTFRESATDVSWDNYREELVGDGVVDWPGTVFEVRAAGDDYEVRVDLDSGGLMSISNVDVVTSDPTAATWAKDTPVLVSGIIQRVDSIMGSVQVQLEDGATVVAAP